MKSSTSCPYISFAPGVRYCGPIALTWMSNRAHSTASVRVMWSTPAREEPVWTMPPAERSAVPIVMLRILPPRPRSIMWRPTARQTVEGAVEIEVDHGPPAVRRQLLGLLRERAAGIVDEDVDPAGLVRDLVDTAARRRRRRGRRAASSSRRRPQRGARRRPTRCAPTVREAITTRAADARRSPAPSRTRCRSAPPVTNATRPSRRRRSKMLRGSLSMRSRGSSASTATGMSDRPVG